jgi:hypothetical protein
VSSVIMAAARLLTASFHAWAMGRTGGPTEAASARALDLYPLLTPAEVEILVKEQPQLATSTYVFYPST